MGLLGGGAMVAFYDVISGAEEQHDNWHSYEHMPERVGIPGFIRGRRWIATSGAPRIFVMYEVENFEVLTSEVYLERLNNPTPWSGETMANIRNMIRALCSVSASEGVGVGSLLLSIRFSPKPEQADALRTWLREELLPELPKIRGLLGAHLLEAVKDAVKSQTKEQKLRGGDKNADWVLMIDAYDSAALEEVYTKELAPAELEAHGALAEQDSTFYRLAYVLTDSDFNVNI